MRKAIGKRLRFDVFKRDGFVCQYCGAHPPSVVLQVDHIKPVASGGQNTIDNLVTSCQPCNIGKGAIGLDDVPQSLAERANAVKESEAQLAGYEKIMSAMRERKEQDAWDVINTMFNRAVESVSQKNFLSVKVFCERLGKHRCIENAEIANLKGPGYEAGRFRYFFAICWRQVREGGL